MVENMFLTSNEFDIAMVEFVRCYTKKFILENR